MIDSSDKDRMGKARSLLHKCFADAELQHVPFLVFANKQDIEGAQSAEQIKENLDVNNPQVSKDG